jgi:beta-lactamase regulating signal transducer with metallopeptidase domain
MNAWGILLAWSAVQVGVLLAAGTGVYLVVRRRNPAAGAWAIAAVLIVAIGLSAAALSPWPQWWSVDDVWSPGSETPAVASASPQKGASGGTSREVAGKQNAEIAPSPSSEAALSAAWREFLAGFQQSFERDEASRAWRWPAWLAVAVLVCIGLGLVRMGVALFAVKRFGARAMRIEDVDARALLAEIKRELGCARRIELRESPGLGSPCTLGWVRPVVILPGDWRTWNESELRSVLAHEVAHVARGDFAVGILSQVGVALHFYNPLVWWLAGRLRLEQEMAADLCGARLAGGRETYLTTLARMALRQSDLPLAARPFLPARGTLLRRVEMLHKEASLPEGTVSWSGRAAVAALLLSASGLLAGFRGPSETIAVAAPPEKSAADATPPTQEDSPDVQFRRAQARVDALQASYWELQKLRRDDPGAVTAEFELAKAEAARSLEVAKQELNDMLRDPKYKTPRLRQLSMNKLKSIGLALHSYHDAHKRFPSAVEIGPDGKTPHSWRVEVLPYFEGEAREIYNRYRLDETWDSENNRKVMAEGARFYSEPVEEPSNDCAYFVLSGPGTVFDPASPASSVRAITDGTSMTMGVVEAKRSIPWTKPEDIPYSTNGPLPKLGGFFEGGFNCVFMDGAAHFIPADLEEPVLRALLSQAGEEFVSIDPKTGRMKLGY